MLEASKLVGELQAAVSEVRSMRLKRHTTAGPITSTAPQYSHRANLVFYCSLNHFSNS